MGGLEGDSLYFEDVEGIIGEACSFFGPIGKFAF